MKYFTCVETAKFVRNALKNQFPGVKFNVVCQHHTSINIGYVNGPALNKVTDITNNFEGATFDPMIDLQEYKTSIFNGEEVHFGANYIFVKREITDDVARIVLQDVCDYYGEDINEFRLFNGQIEFNYKKEHVMREFNKRKNETDF